MQKSYSKPPTSYIYIYIPSGKPASPWKITHFHWKIPPFSSPTAAAKALVARVAMEGETHWGLGARRGGLMYTARPQRLRGETEVFMGKS